MQWGGKKLKVKLRALVFSTDTALPLVTFQSRWCYCLWYDKIVLQWEKSCWHLNLSMLSTFERKRIRGKSWLQAETIANTLEEASASVEQLPWSLEKAQLSMRKLFLPWRAEEKNPENSNHVSPFPKRKKGKEGKRCHSCWINIQAFFPPHTQHPLKRMRCCSEIPRIVS